ncbi:MAG: 4a-hydroxytetrahydrobiopterin dehydratase [Actinomycetota bacterium]
MEELASRKCEACEGGVPPLTGEQAAQLHSQIDPAWELDDDELERTFKFSNFRDPFALATRIALLAEEQGHHPDLEISWGKLEVSLKTHSIGGLSDNDFIMAAKIDEMT